MTELIVGGEVFNVRVDGRDDAPVLMLSNSLGTNLHMWDKQIDALTQHFRVVRYDSRGHGGSVVTEGPYTIAELGHDAIAIMDALGFETVHWLGLSKGGMVGQWLLTHRAHRIGRAVLANTAAQIGSADTWNERIRTVLDEGMSALVPAVLERWFTRNFRETHPHEVDKIRTVLEATSPIGYAGCCAAIRDMDQLAALPSVKSPVLVIVGRHDPSTPPGMGALIASAIPGAKLVTLDTAHLSNIEDTSGFNHAVLEFLTADETAQHDHEPASHRRREPAPHHEPAAHHEHETTPHRAAHDGEAPEAETAEEPAAPAAQKKPRRKPAPRKAPEPAAETPTARTEAEAAAGEASQPAAAGRPARRAPAPATPAPSAPAARRRPAKKAARKAPARGVAKKAPAKKAAAKKAPGRKAATKKTAPRKVAVKKTARKTAARKTATRKAATRKTAAKRAPARKAVAKKTASRKTAVKKSVTKKSATKKIAVRKSAAKKSAVKKPLRRLAVRRAPARGRRR